MEINDKVFVVTGAGSGIGRELCFQLLKKNARVAGIDIQAQALQETQALIGVDEQKFKGFILDITNKSDVDNLPAKIQEHFGEVDGIINNAGIIQPFKTINEISLTDIERVMNVNFYGTVYLTKAFLPFFLQRPTAHIVNISSMGGFLPVPGQTIYGAAKAAVKLFTEGLNSELADTNVKVTVVFPGAIATNITENSGLGKPQKPQKDSPIKPMPAIEAARLIIEAIEKNRYRVTIGRDATFLDFLYRINPKYAAGLIQKKMKSILS